MDAALHHPSRPTSAMLEDLIHALDGQRVSVGELIDHLDARAYGLLLLVLALPMCVPNVPGISTVFGVLMLFPALGMVVGARRLWAPAQLRAKEIDGEVLRRTLKLAIPALRRVEYLVRPRFALLTQFPMTIAVGLQTLLMALILILPIPFANWPPGMTVAMTALALLQRDGLLMLLTIPAAMISVGSVYFGAYVGLAAINGAVEWLQHFWR
ncbi:MAG: exopolysaccharide biosynthesis protein [Terricaulis sp.]|nr:exopolysaccharide biosynthesis protein [Terricaulis sp.]